MNGKDLPAFQGIISIWKYGFSDWIQESGDFQKEYYE